MQRSVHRCLRTLLYAGRSSGHSTHARPNYIGHTYIGHSYIDHDYIGHNYTGHNYIGRVTSSGRYSCLGTCLPTPTDKCWPLSAYLSAHMPWSCGYRSLQRALLGPTPISHGTVTKYIWVAERARLLGVELRAHVRARLCVHSYAYGGGAGRISPLWQQA